MKSLNARIVHTHDTAEKWDSLENFVPRKGEIIIYDPDNSYSYARMKIGDGITVVKDLPFANSGSSDPIFEVDGNNVYLDGGRITNYS